MAGLDLLSLGVSLFDPESSLVQFNQKLHTNSLYNGFQITISALDVFTAGFTKGMKTPVCFASGIAAKGAFYLLWRKVMMDLFGTQIIIMKHLRKMNNEVTNYSV